MSIVPEVVPGLQQYQQSTVTAGDDAKDTALCKNYICNAIRPKDIDKQVVPMPPGIKHSFLQNPIVGSRAFSELVRRRRHEQGKATYGLMASWGRGFKEFAADMLKMLREYRFLANLGYEFVVLIGDQQLDATDLGRWAEQWLNLLSGWKTCPFNMNLHVGGSGSGGTGKQTFVIIGYLFGTAAPLGLAGVLTDYRRAAIIKLNEEIKQKKGPEAGTEIWETYMRYDRILRSAFNGVELTVQDKRCIHAWQQVCAVKLPYKKTAKQVFEHSCISAAV
jgi:hypothetical protein